MLVKVRLKFTNIRTSENQFKFFRFRSQLGPWSVSRYQQFLKGQDDENKTFSISAPPPLCCWVFMHNSHWFLIIAGRNPTKILIVLLWWNQPVNDFYRRIMHNIWSVIISHSQTSMDLNLATDRRRVMAISPNATLHETRSSNILLYYIIRSFKNVMNSCFYTQRNLS